MNKFLIHSNNSSFVRSEFFKISEQFVFDVDSDKDVDFYIDDILVNGELKQKLNGVDIVFIKVALSQNYLEYLGLRLAYHIRLSKSLGLKANIPIIFIGEESVRFLGITYSEPSIIFTKGIYFIKESNEDLLKAIELFDKSYFKGLEDSDEFVNSIRINPPSNYQSHHTIANEWALFRYFSMFEKDENNELYIKLKNKIQNLDYLKTLHFKYLESKANRQKFKVNKHTLNSPIINGIEKMKVGVIDDEINKGWLEFYNYILGRSNANSVPFNDFRKGENREELIKRIQEWLLNSFNSNEPIDLFIVDLRLHDDDFERQDFENLSGIQIVKFIKSQNKGVQIVVSTASNKVWNFQNCLEFGVKHFSIKESPESYSTRDESKATLTHLCKEISSCSKAVFLASLFRDIEVLKNKNIFINNISERGNEFKDLVFGINGLLDKIFNLLILEHTNDTIINQCLLLSFQILENYCDLSGIVGLFGKDTTNKLKLSSGSVWPRDGSVLKQIFVNIESEKISSWFELTIGKFDFQSLESKDTPTSFKVFDSMSLISSHKSGLDSSTLVKIISVLYFRDDITKIEIDRILKLRYYRSNVAAHLTGNVNQNSHFKISSKEIEFFINIFIKIFT